MAASGVYDLDVGYSLMAKVLSGHELAYYVFNSSIITPTCGDLMKLLMGGLYSRHMPWIVLLLLFLYGAYIEDH